VSEQQKPDSGASQRTNPPSPLSGLFFCSAFQNTLSNHLNTCLECQRILTENLTTATEFIDQIPFLRKKIQKSLQGLTIEQAIQAYFKIKAGSN
jgi:hypothetical protein